MEVSFRPGITPRRVSSLLVSILVLMEVSFRLQHGHLLPTQTLGFNPCFNGSIFQTAVIIVFVAIVGASFNPCFNGSIFQTYEHKIIDRKEYDAFQSLF